MKINFLCGGLVKSGGMRIIFEYANRLQNAGHDVVCYVPLKPLNYGVENRVLTLKRYFWSIKDYMQKAYYSDEFYRRIFELKIVPSLTNFYIRKAEVSIATQWPTAYLLNELVPSRGSKLYFVQGYEVWKSDVKKVDASYKLQMKIITNSSYLKSLLFEKFAVESDVVLNGIDFKRFNHLRKSLNRNLTISFISHTLSQKGSTEAIQILNSIKNKYPDTNIMSFGLESRNDLPKSYIFQLNPNEEQIMDIYNQSDIFLFTSRQEGFGLPPAEAMACKTAVVTTDVGAIPEFSTHNYSALHFKPSDVKTAISHVSSLIDNPAERERISQNAYVDVRKKLNWDESVKKFVTIIEGIQK